MRNGDKLSQLRKTISYMKIFLVTIGYEFIKYIGKRKNGGNFPGMSHDFIMVIIYFFCPSSSIFNIIHKVCYISPTP